MKKFENVDVIASLEAVMRLNTMHYQSDYTHDIETIRKSADSRDPDDHILLWMSRPAGTWCFRERNVFLRESEAFFTWNCYRGSQDAILAYAVEITGKADGKVTGHLYELDYQAHAARITKAALPADQITVTFQDGSTRRFDYLKYHEGWRSIENRYGKIMAIQYEPASAEELQDILRAERDSRAKLSCGEIKDHLRALADDKIFAEARHLNDKLQKLDAPNSPGRMHFIRQVRRSPSVKKQLQTAREAAPSAPKRDNPTEKER